MAADGSIPVIQLAITPVILISGMGSLMLTMTNRMGRIVDRTRILAGQVQTAKAAADRQHLESQLQILWRRARLIRLAVTFNGLSMLVACGLVMTIFLDSILGHGLAALMIALFGTSVLLLALALGTFLRDIFVALDALHLEVQRAETASRPEPAEVPKV